MTMLKKVHDPIEIDAPGNTSHTAKRCDATVTKCYWCNCAFRARQSGGHAQRFCSPSCRLAFHAATRRWTLDAVGAGVLSIADIKKGTLQRACCRKGHLMPQKPSAPVAHRTGASPTPSCAAKK